MILARQVSSMARSANIKQQDRQQVRQQAAPCRRPDNSPPRTVAVAVMGQAPGISDEQHHNNSRWEKPLCSE